jgi:hypothetical protein
LMCEPQIERTSGRTQAPVCQCASTQHARRKTQAHAARRQQAAQADAASKKRTLVNETWFTLLCNKVQINAMHLIQCRFLVHLQQAIAIVLQS